ncbi:Gfo/Idh/MocA family protein [Paenarthrobacter nitroguajacolicus]|uniref:Gfo/Idh/MocA family protein n=1 Tax=Paenarthrobacter nitroguajacolicus TaxID=211146 RepID=UPI00248B51AD|nr:Gfo/Idh/MocA family oxidoreductase [Paenarthrobacter nitroguajacolicus]MDI2035595.1 Inositol 2-dehydrogenase/D-chiro-inositol 3-dehydrogenase [Paenarthrobacter nitroguajacolicus]
MSALRIAVVGAGLIGRRHIEIIKQSQDAKLSAVVDPFPAAAGIAAEAGVAYYRTLDELFLSEKPDAVVLATPNALHVNGALHCLEVRVPVLVEKPIAQTVEEAQRLVDAEDSAGVPVLIGHHRRHSPLLEAARKIVFDGVLGRLVAISGTALFYKPDDYFEAAPWRREAGGGPVLINMIHEVDNLRALCGEVTRVQAVASNSARGFEVEDTVAITLSFANGALGTFLLSDAAASARSWEQTSQEDKSYPTYEEEDCYLISGTRGSLSVPTMRLKTYADKASWWEPFETSTADVVREDPLERQLKHFIAVARGECQPIVTARDGLQTLRVTEAIAEAARTGNAVDIPAA